MKKTSLQSIRESEQTVKPFGYFLLYFRSKSDKLLGTGYEREIRFLSAIDKPVMVLQLTGVLIDPKGNVVRAGSEAFFHEDTPFWAQVLEMSKVIDDKTLQNAVLSEIREDLPGSPLAWKIAVNNLLQQLTQRPALL